MKRREEEREEKEGEKSKEVKEKRRKENSEELIQAYPSSLIINFNEYWISSATFHLFLFFLPLLLRPTKVLPFPSLLKGQ